MNTNVFDAVFWSFFITSGIGFVLAIARFAYKSKCSKIDVCCIKIERNTNDEIKEDELELQKSRITKQTQEEEEKSNNNNI